MQTLTFSTFLRKYPNEDACLDEIFKKKYPDHRAYCENCKKVTRKKISMMMICDLSWETKTMVKE